MQYRDKFKKAGGIKEYMIEARKRKAEKEGTK